MSKRKQTTANDADDSDDDSNPTIDVDFDFFDPNPQTDYHALLRLLRQLFLPNPDNPDPDIDLHGLAELILAQPLVGTSIKTDGRDSDPLAYLTVLNLCVHQDNPSIKSLIAYILNKSSPNQPLHTTLQSLLPSPNNPSSPNTHTAHVGFIFSERLINMPVQVVPPMYRMLADEIKWALDDNEPYTFSHLIFISRTYRLSPEEESSLPPSNTPHPAKRQKASNNTNSNSNPTRGLGLSPDGVYPFHPEDEYIQKLASHTHDYPLTQQQHQPPREKDAFGLDTRGRMMLLPAERFLEVVSVLGEVFGVDANGVGGGGGSA